MLFLEHVVHEGELLVRGGEAGQASLLPLEVGPRYDLPVLALHLLHATTSGAHLLPGRRTYGYDSVRVESEK